MLDGVAFFRQEVSRRLGFGETLVNAVWDTENLQCCGQHVRMQRGRLYTQAWSLGERAELNLSLGVTRTEMYLKTVEWKRF